MRKLKNRTKVKKLDKIEEMRKMDETDKIEKKSTNDKKIDLQNRDDLVSENEPFFASWIPLKINNGKPEFQPILEFSSSCKLASS